MTDDNIIGKRLDELDFKLENRPNTFGVGLAILNIARNLHRECVEYDRLLTDAHIRTKENRETIKELQAEITRLNEPGQVDDSEPSLKRVRLVD